LIFEHYLNIAYLVPFQKSS